MLQIIDENKRPSFLQSVMGGIADNAPAAFEKYQQSQQNAKANKTASDLLGFDTSGLDPETRKALMVEGLKQKGKGTRQGETQTFLSQLFGGIQGSQSNDFSMQSNEEVPSIESITGQNPQKDFDASKLTDENIAIATSMDPNLGRALAHAKDVALRENRENEQNKNKQFESDRAYHTQFSKPIEEKATALRGLLPKQEMAIDYARNAIESGEVGAFSINHLADIFGADSLRNAKGAQLILASKEQLIPNLGRISAKAQNIFMEKRIASMIPQIGLKDEANLTMQEMIEGEAAIDRAYLSELDRLAEQDMKEYGFTRKDIDKRARANATAKEKEIVKRTSYRMKEIEENSKGLSKVKKEVGENVSKGTPLTLAMAKLYQDKFGDNALKVAEKNGYYIPTKEEFMMFEQRPSEFRESL